LSAEQDRKGERASESASGAPTSQPGRQIGAAALLLAGSVLLSRVLGFVREMVLAAEIGVGPSTDAYYAAFQIPDLLNYLLAGGAIAVAFTPLYLRTLRQEGEAEAESLLRTVHGTVGALVVVLTVLLWIYADALIALQFGGFTEETRALTVKLTRIVLPGQIFFVTGGILRAVLMAHGRFGAQAAAPILYNLGIIAGGLIGGGIEGFAWGALVGAVLGMWAYPVLDMRHVGSMGVRIAPLDPRFHAYLWRALPLMIGLSLTTVDEWYERIFGAGIGEGVVASLAFARKLMMAPVAIIGQAVAAAALPTLALLHSEGRSRDLDLTLERTLRGSIALAILAACLILVFTEPFVAVMYQRGAFGAEDVARVAVLLAILAFAVPGWVTQQVAIRAFFAREETWRPMLLGTAMAVLALPVYIGLGERLGAPGLALAGVLAISANALATLAWARIRFGGPALLPLLTTALRALVVGGIAGGAGWLVLELGGWRLNAYTALFLGGSISGLTAMAAIWAVGDSLMRSLLASVMRHVPGLRGLAARLDA
jgi:putative peptidoglycan lipid II flippase